MLLLSILAHEGGPGDPVLLEWIKHQIDAVFGLGPAAIVISLSFVVITIPIAIMLVFFFQRMRHSRP
ncbi:MAG: hypothetical protein IIB15_01775 [Chloroflexi bacterium]|nr:hypothetical protein [Chloroflexota bacterium]